MSAFFFSVYYQRLHESGAPQNEIREKATAIHSFYLDMAHSVCLIGVLRLLAACYCSWTWMMWIDNISGYCNCCSHWKSAIQTKVIHPRLPLSSLSCDSIIVCMCVLNSKCASSGFVWSSSCWSFSLVCESIFFFSTIFFDLLRRQHSTFDLPSRLIISTLIINRLENIYPLFVQRIKTKRVRAPPPPV